MGRIEKSANQGRVFAMQYVKCNQMAEIRILFCQSTCSLHLCPPRLSTLAMQIIHSNRTNGSLGTARESHPTQPRRPVSFSVPHLCCPPTLQPLPQKPLPFHCLWSRPRLQSASTDRRYPSQWLPAEQSVYAFRTRHLSGSPSGSPPKRLPGATARP
jgi:hypothetical protein